MEAHASDRLTLYGVLRSTHLNPLGSCPNSRPICRPELVAASESTRSNKYQARAGEDSVPVDAGVGTRVRALRSGAPDLRSSISPRAATGMAAGSYLTLPLVALAARADPLRSAFARLPGWCARAGWERTIRLSSGRTEDPHGMTKECCRQVSGACGFARQ